MSTIPAVKAALATVIGAAISGAQVINGPASSVTTLADRVVEIGNAAGVRELDSLTLGTTSERYMVELTFSASLSGTDQTAATALALADYEAAELAIREYSGGPGLGLSASGVLQVLPTGEFSLQEQADSNVRNAAVRSSVSVYAQNT